MISSPMISSMRSSTGLLVVLLEGRVAPALTRKDTKCAAALARRLADQKQMGAASLEVVKRLEAVEVGLGFGKRKQRELGNRELVFRVVRDELRSVDMWKAFNSLS